MENCIFCKIVKKEIHADIVFENDSIVVFKDINPEAPVHVLVVPKKHIENINKIEDCDIELLYKIHEAGKITAKLLGIDQTGYRLITNCGVHAGQTVFHLHYHLLGGKNLGSKLLGDN